MRWLSAFIRPHTAESFRSPNRLSSWFFDGKSLRKPSEVENKQVAKALQQSTLCRRPQRATPAPISRIHDPAALQNCAWTNTMRYLSVVQTVFFSVWRGISKHRSADRKDQSLFTNFKWSERFLTPRCPHDLWRLFLQVLLNGLIGHPPSYKNLSQFEVTSSVSKNNSRFRHWCLEPMKGLYSSSTG
ncbi:hypothetical protein C8F01DRAFT_744363 [Mycena amicta]|nr:hypothetical protein C8F01DRAFT_744363 [Mycena amicta]